MFGFGALERRATVRGKRPRKRRDEAGAANAPIIAETPWNFERFFEIFVDSTVVENGESDGRLRGVGYKD